MVFKGFFCSQTPFSCTFWSNLTKVKFEFLGSFGGQKWSFLRFYMCFLNFFFEKIFGSQNVRKYVKNVFLGFICAWRWFLCRFGPSTTILKFWNFWQFFTQKRLFFHFWGVILEFFFQNEILCQNYSEIHKNAYFQLFQVPNIIFMWFWAILDKVKFWLFGHFPDQNRPVNPIVSWAGIVWQISEPAKK